MKHFFLHYFENPRTRSYGYVKYRISNLSRKRSETTIHFKVIKHNAILDFIDTCRILWKAVFDESRMYNLEGDLSYLSKSTLQYGSKATICDSFFAHIKRKRILDPLSRSCQVEVLRKKKLENPIQFILID